MERLFRGCYALMLCQEQTIYYQQEQHGVVCGSTHPAHRSQVADPIEIDQPSTWPTTCRGSRVDMETETHFKEWGESAGHDGHTAWETGGLVPDLLGRGSGVSSRWAGEPLAERLGNVGRYGRKYDKYDARTAKIRLKREPYTPCKNQLTLARGGADGVGVGQAAHLRGRGGLRGGAPGHAGAASQGGGAGNLGNVAGHGGAGGAAG
eukprot:5035190-Pyramimonas_sp.AAC.1